MHFYFSQPVYNVESSGLRKNTMDPGLAHGLQLTRKSPEGEPKGTTLPCSPRTLCPGAEGVWAPALVIQPFQSCLRFREDFS